MEAPLFERLLGLVFQPERRRRGLLADGGAVRGSIQVSLGMEQVALPSGVDASGCQQDPGERE